MSEAVQSRLLLLSLFFSILAISSSFIYHSRICNVAHQNLKESSSKSRHVSYAATEKKEQNDFESILPIIVSDFESMTKSMTTNVVLSSRASSYFEKFEGPGHVTTNPISLRDSSRVQLAKVVVGLAVSYITLKVKYEAFTSSVIPALAPRNSTAISGNMRSDQSFVKLSNGITMQDTVVGNEMIEVGDRVSIETTLFYNGLPVESVNSDLAATPLLFGSDELVSKVFGAFYVGRNELAVSSGYEILKGMRLGGKRKLLLPSALAFGDKGFPPYVPPNAFVVYDIQMKPYDSSVLPVIDVGVEFLKES